MSLKIELDHSKSVVFDGIQLDHSHGTTNKKAITTTKQSTIDSTNKTNLKGDIF